MILPTLYVAGPMTGKPQMNYPHFHEVGDALRDCGYGVLNPVDVDAMHLSERKKLMLPTTCAECDAGGKHDWEWYMRRTLKMMLDADGIALLRGWEGSRGAKIEVAVAAKLGMSFRPWQSWVLDVRANDGDRPGTRRNKEDRE